MSQQYNQQNLNSSSVTPPIDINYVLPNEDVKPGFTNSITKLPRKIKICLNMRLSVSEAESFIGQKYVFYGREQQPTSKTETPKNLKQALSCLTKYGKFESESNPHSYNPSERSDPSKYWKYYDQFTVEFLGQQLAMGYAAQPAHKVGGNGEEHIDGLLDWCFLDFDHFDEDVARKANPEIFVQHSIFYYTPSYDGENKKPFRLVFVFSRGVTPKEYEIITYWMNYSFGTHTGMSMKEEKEVTDKYVADLSCCNPGRFMYGCAQPELMRINENRVLDVDKYLPIAQQFCDENKKKSSQSSKTRNLVSQDDEQDNLSAKIEKDYLKKIFPDGITDYLEATKILFDKFNHEWQAENTNPKESSQGIIHRFAGRCPWSSGESPDTLVVSWYDNGRFPAIYDRSKSWEVYDKKTDSIKSGSGIWDYWKHFDKENNYDQDNYFKELVKNFAKEKGVEPFDFRKKNSKQLMLLEAAERLQEELGDRLKYNLMQQCIELDQNQFLLETVTIWFAEQTGIELQTHHCIEIVLRQAKQNSYHPVQEWLQQNGMENGNVDVSILDNLSTRFFGTEAELYNLYIKLFFIGAVKRVFEPGCKHDSVLILQGTQGIGKSTFFEKLMPISDWKGRISFEGNNDTTEKMKLRRFWFGEFDELDAIFGKKSIAALRSLITTPSDDYRPPYGRDIMVVKRQSVLVGTVNEKNVLNDPEGNRRFWIIPIQFPFVNIDLVEKERNLYWAAALKLYLQGHINYLSREQEIEREKLNEEFVENDAITEHVLPTAKRFSNLTILQLGKLLGMTENGIMKKPDQMRLTNILKMAKWVKGKKVMYEGTFYHIWMNPQSAEGQKDFKDIVNMEKLGNGNLSQLLLSGTLDSEENWTLDAQN